MDGLPPCRRLTACHAHSSPIIRKVCDQLLLLSFRTSCISVVRRISFDRHSFGSPSIRRRLREGRFASSCCGFRVLNAKMNREYGLPPSWRCFEHFKPFLSEKTEGPNGRWWYTHRYLRKAVSLVRGCTDEAFTFLIAPSVPKTSNHVEGGLNASLKEHLHRHRGLSTERQRALVALFLTDWNLKNSCTRNIT